MAVPHLPAPPPGVSPALPAETLAGFDHDLRTLLARLRVEVELAVADPAARARLATDIELLDAMLDRLRDLSRNRPSVPTRLNLLQAVDRELALFAREAAFLSRRDIDPTLTVLADETELGRILRNLVHNAIRHGRHPRTGLTTLRIAARGRPGQIELTLRDDGPGVSALQLERLTLRRHGSGGIRHAGTGSGLGLWIVQQALGELGGRLDLENAPGGGLLVRLCLPRAD